MSVLGYEDRGSHLKIVHKTQVDERLRRKRKSKDVHKSDSLHKYKSFIHISRVRIFRIRTETSYDITCPLLVLTLSVTTVPEMVVNHSVRSLFIRLLIYSLWFISTISLFLYPHYPTLTVVNPRIPWTDLHPNERISTLHSQVHEISLTRPLCFHLIHYLVALLSRLSMQPQHSMSQN